MIHRLGEAHFLVGCAAHRKPRFKSAALTGQGWARGAGATTRATSPHCEDVALYKSTLGYD
jgi:hypothetical protein